MALDPVTDQFSQFLRLAFFRSPNFLTGVSGWTINQDGSAEFNNVTVRGTIIASHFVGSGQGQEVLIYSGAPAANNLIFSICSVAGTDSSGNKFLAGFTSYNNAGNLAIGMSGNSLTIYSGTLAAGWTPQGTYSGDTVGNLTLTPAGTGQITASGAALEVATLLKLDDHAAPASPTSAVFHYSDTNSNPHFKLPSSFTGAIPGTQTDTTDRTVTQTGATQLGANFSIPASDAVVGTTYRYRCGGTGQWGSTQQQLTLIDSLTATNVNQVNVAAAAFAASAPVDWELDIQVTIKTTGAGGTCNVRMTLAISVNNAAALGTNGLTAVRRAAGVAINTLVANSLQLNALWASTTGAPTITANNSTFERIGP